MVKEYVKSIKELEEARLRYESLTQQLKEKIESKVSNIEVTFSFSNPHIVHLNSTKEEVFQLMSLSFEGGDIRVVYANITDSTLEELLSVEKAVREELSK